jgi:hypothetical protein
VALRAAGFEAESFAITWQHPPPLTFPCDRRIRQSEYGSPAWRRHVDSFTHHLVWNGISPYGPQMQRLPARSALVFRGSELRIPAMHRRLQRWSPFPAHPQTGTLTRRALAVHRRLRGNRLPTYVATLEMLDYLPTARWLPIIADAAPARPVLRRKRPVVLHVPTDAPMKGSQHVDGLDLPHLDIRRPGLMKPSKMLEAIAEADIVIGNLLLGDYGGTEIQAMAAGRVVIANIDKRVRQRIAGLPIVHATPDTLRAVLSDIDRDAWRERAEAGRAFHAQYHDGRYSVEQLTGFLEGRAAA